MAFARTHALVMTAPDDPAFENNPSDWNDDHSVSGADVGGIPYCPTATTETTSAKFIFDGVTLALAMGTVTAAPGAISITQTRNAAGTTFDGVIKAVITDTDSAAGSLAMQILGGASGTTNLVSLTKGGSPTFGSDIASFGGTTSSFYSLRGRASFVYQPEFTLADNSARAVGWISQWCFRNTASTYTAAVSVTDDGAGGLVKTAAAGVFAWSSTTDALGGASDTGFSRISAGLIGVGTGAAGSFAGSLKLTNITAVGDVDAVTYHVNGAAGADFGPGLPTSITVVKGIITAIS